MTNPNMTVAELAEDRDAIHTLLSGYYAGPGETVLLRSVDNMQTALRGFLNPAPDEPTDLAVRVVDSEGDEWARMHRGWFNNQGGGPSTWEEVLTYSPLTIVTPDPTPAARELRVGDRVRVSSTALRRDGQPSRWAGRYGRIVELHNPELVSDGFTSLHIERKKKAGYKRGIVRTEFLSLADDNA